MADQDLDSLIGAALRQARLERLRTQEELGEALGVGRTAISHYETGRRELTVKHLLSLAQALGCQPTELLPTSYQPSTHNMLSPALAQIVHMLEERSDLIPTVIDLLETRLVFEQQEETLHDTQSPSETRVP